MEGVAGELSNSHTDDDERQTCRTEPANSEPNHANDNDNSSERAIPDGEGTPENASQNKPIDNSIFNTISNIVNPPAKVSIHHLYHFNFSSCFTRLDSSNRLGHCCVKFCVRSDAVIFLC